MTKSPRGLSVTAELFVLNVACHVFLDCCAISNIICSFSPVKLDVIIILCLEIDARGAYVRGGAYIRGGYVSGFCCRGFGLKIYDLRQGTYDRAAYVLCPCGHLHRVGFFRRHMSRD